MDSKMHQDYVLALSALNTVVGLRFNELQSAQTSTPRNELEILRLKDRFESVYAQREALPHANVDRLKEIVQEFAPEVREKVMGIGHGSE